MKGLVMKNVYVKYQKPTTYGSRDIIKVKVFVTDRQTDEWDLMSPCFRESGDNNLETDFLHRFCI